MKREKKTADNFKDVPADLHTKEMRIILIKTDY